MLGNTPHGRAKSETERVLNESIYRSLCELVGHAATVLISLSAFILTLYISLKPASIQNVFLSVSLLFIGFVLH